MTRRHVKSLQPFAFRPDFAPQPAASEAVAVDDTVRLSRADYTALVRDVTTREAEAARAPLEAEALARLEAALLRMEHATCAFSDLAAALARLAEDGRLPADLAERAERAARDLRDGQGDLFAACKPFRRHSDLPADSGLLT